MKKWTVGIYANGNNEIEPEIWEAVTKLQLISPSDEVSVLVQIGRQERKMTQIIRPLENYEREWEEWSGVRRYRVDEGQLILLEELGNKNMADPLNLYEFLKWMKTTDSAEHYMLIVGGHIYQFVGMTPDFTQDKPYLLGFPEFTAAIQKVCEAEGFRIDLLVLDTCYACTYEVLCEWARYKRACVEVILTYIGKGPGCGMPYEMMIQLIINDINKESKELAREMIQALAQTPLSEYPLIAIKIDSSILKMCKDMFHRLAYTYIHSDLPDKKELTPYELLTTMDKAMPWYKFVEYIQVMHNMLIIEKSLCFLGAQERLPIHVLYKKIPDETRKALYKRAYFAKNNDWIKLIYDDYKLVIEEDEAPKLEPISISRYILYAFICNANPTLSDEKQEEVTRNLINTRQWGNIG